MDFKLSYHWLKEFVDVRMPPEELAELLSLHSVSVERMHRLDEELDHRVVVGQIVNIEAHPNADRLRVVGVALTPAGARSLKSDARVVCGGTNLQEGLLIAFAPVGARVRWHGQGDFVALAPAEIRGVVSEGMICAASEIGLGEYFPSASEREILDVSFLGASTVGNPLAVTLGLDDVIFDVEVTTNRVDLMSVEELAREVAAITNAECRVQNARRTSKKLSPARYPFSIRLDDRSACPRYGAVVIDGVRVGPSPWDVRRKLIAAGMHPVNSVVDATNLVMLELGQPLHAFDADRVAGAAITVRRAVAGESLVALDGQTHALTPAVLVIADAERPIAIAGVIGGQKSGVNAQTTRIVLECATFDAATIRRGARAIHVRTDAAIRFEKGLQPEAITAALPYAVERIIALAGGTAGKSVIAGAKSRPVRAITFRPAVANGTIGVAVPASTMRRMFTALGCRVAGSGATWRVTPPWWRRDDLTAHHDLVEEVARLYGYHRLPALLPDGTLPAVSYPALPARSSFDVEQRCRELLADLGAVEVLPFTLTSAAAIRASGYVEDQAVALENPLSEEYAYLRPSLLTTFLPLIAQHQGHTPKGMVFEMGNVYVPNLKSARSAELPREELRLCIAAYGRLMDGGHVEHVKGMVERLCAGLGARDVVFRVSEQCATPAGACRWHPGRTMDMVVDGVLVGVIGEVHPTVVEAAGIDARVAAADLDWEALVAHLGAPCSMMPPPAHPAVKRDLAIVVDRKTTYAQLAAAFGVFDPALVGFELFDQYEGGNVPAGKKSLAFHLEYRAPDRTLTSEEVDRAHAALIARLGIQFGAEVRE